MRSQLRIYNRGRAHLDLRAQEYPAGCGARVRLQIRAHRRKGARKVLCLPLRGGQVSWQHNVACQAAKKEKGRKKISSVIPFPPTGVSSNDREHINYNLE